MRYVRTFCLTFTNEIKQFLDQEMSIFDENEFEEIKSHRFNILQIFSESLLKLVILYAQTHTTYDTEIYLGQLENA